MRSHLTLPSHRTPPMDRERLMREHSTVHGGFASDLATIHRQASQYRIDRVGLDAVGLQRVSEMADKRGEVFTANPASAMNRNKVATTVGDRPIERRTDELAIHPLQTLDRYAFKEMGQLGVTKHSRIHVGNDFGEPITATENFIKRRIGGHQILGPRRKGQETITHHRRSSTRAYASKQMGHLFLPIRLD